MFLGELAALGASIAPIFLIPLGRIFKEPSSARSIRGTVVALAGVALLFLE